MTLGGVVELNAVEWAYRAEGGRNLVVSYCGDRGEMQGKVLRLAKRKPGARRGGGGGDACEAAYKFAREAVAPLLAPRRELLLLGRLIAVTAPFLAEVHERCLPLRPAHRLALEVDAAAAHAWLLPDLTRLPGVPAGVLAVELKPKSCVLPAAGGVARGHEAKARISRFAMMQRWKLAAGRAAAISSYDPLDLFSGDAARVRGALLALLCAPQNNLRVHADGGDALGEGGGLAPSPALRGVLGEGGGEEAFAALLEAALHDSGVLQAVARLQRLCAFDIESVAPAERHLKDPVAYPEEAARAAAPAQLPPVAEWEGIVESFLLAQSAKDCSVFFALAPLPDGAPAPALEASGEGVCFGVLEHPEGSGRRVVYRCALVDLDIKSREKIEGYLQQDREILEAYLRAERGGQAEGGPPEPSEQDA